MLVYHGSNSNFKQFRIDKSLVKHESTLNNEGLGIYFTTDINIAKSYGKFVYSAYVNDTYLIDFRYKRNCVAYINRMCAEVYKKTGVNIHNYIDTGIVAKYLHFGGVAIINAGDELWNCLDSTEKWFELPKTKMEAVHRILKSYGKNNLKAYMFNYHIPNIGVIKVISDDVVQMMDKTPSHLIK